MARIELYTEAVVTLVTAETNSEGVTFPTTRVFRLEFDTLEAAESWLEAGTDSRSVMNYTSMRDANGEDE
jgi:hypothetical protein